jgi:hypothetical protein
MLDELAADSGGDGDVDRENDEAEEGGEILPFEGER